MITKHLAIALAAFSAVSLCGTELWNGGGDTVRVTMKMTNHQVTVSDGALTVEATSNDEKYGYLTFDIPVTPFQFEGKSLALEYRLIKPLEGDSFYVKCLDAQSQVVASFYTFARPEQWMRLICSPGQNTGGVTFFAKNIKAPEGTTVTRIQFFAGRKCKDTPVKVEIRNIGLIE